MRGQSTCCEETVVGRTETWGASEDAPGHPGKVGAGTVIADKVAHVAGPGVYFAGGNSSISSRGDVGVGQRGVRDHSRSFRPE